MKYRVLLFDVDETLLDFKQGSKNAFKKTLAKYKVTYHEPMFSQYHEVNQSLWEKYERKEISKNEIFEQRFKLYFKKYHLQVDSTLFQPDYQIALNQEAIYLPHAEEVLRYLKQKGYDVCYVSNGLISTQTSRLKLSGLDQFATHIYLSETYHIAKPDSRLFDFCKKDYPNLEKKDFLMIGDSLTSDIQFGENCGIDTLWVHPPMEEEAIRNQKKNYKINYEVDSLLKLKEIL